MNVDEQKKLLNLFRTQFRDEYESFPESRTDNPHEYFVTNDGFASVDGEILYCMIREFKPEHIIEIGSGKYNVPLRTGHP